MNTVATVQARIVAAMSPVRTERVALQEALGRVLASPVVSRRTLPPFDNSGMDGYAVRWTDPALGSRGETWHHIGGYLGMATAVAALYASFADVVNANFKRVILPTF